MTSEILAYVLSAIVVFVLGLQGCVYHEVYPGAPPPHAPAHGYRYQHAGDHLVYNAGIGVYTVVGHPDVYFYETHYYRYRAPYWTVSVDLDGPWHRVDYRRVPPGLAKKHHRRHHGHG